MTRLRMLLLAAVAVVPAMPAIAAETHRVAERRPAPPPSVLSAQERSNYREIFAAIAASDWSGAAARLDAAGDGPLHGVARAQLYLAKGSPEVSLHQLMELLGQAPDLPQAPQLARLATTRGAEMLPDLPKAQTLIWQGSQPRRERIKSVRGDPAAAALDAQIQPLIVADQPREAEALLDLSADLGSEARTEFQQRIAWSYYLTGDDRAARALADKARVGPGEWALQGEWTAGLAAWRMRDCAAAANHFAAVAARSSDVELIAAGHYWAARADMMCERPERVQPRLRSAARLKETFYGLLATSALGIRTINSAGLHDYRDAEWKTIAQKPNVRAAIGLAELGQTNLADELIKYQARIQPADHDELIHLATDLNLPSTQFWLAHNAPRGASVNLAARYPAPDWRPTGGWRVDPSLVYAHALQESNFRTEVISPAGAQGLMQVRPGTAGDIARSRGQAFDRAQLNRPADNMEFGQSYLEALRDNAGTGGLLPKVIAAYNAGPAPITAWNGRRADKGDPLLYIESIPYWETRGYVPIVLRNYWIYEQQAAKASTSRAALVQGLWPRFPGLPGANAVRVAEGKSQAVALNLP